MTIPQEIQDLMPEKEKEQEIEHDGTGLGQIGFNQCHDQWTAVLPQMLALAEKRGAEGMLNKINKEIGKRIDEWENSEDWDGTLNDGLYSLAYYVQTLTQPNHD